MTPPAQEVELATEKIIGEIRALPMPDTPSIRAVRRARTKEWKTRSPQFITAVALSFSERGVLEWIGYELIRSHAAAFAAVDDRLLVKLSKGLDSWGSVDAFGRILSGPAWAHGFASDTLIEKWSRSDNRWLRRSALVSTVALNVPRDGGHGDAARTLAICQRLARDRDDMVEKALSWALRALIPHDAKAVRAFLAEHEEHLAARVKREVSNKLRTGLKNPTAKKQ